MISDGNRRIYSERIFAHKIQAVTRQKRNRSGRLPGKREVEPMKQQKVLSERLKQLCMEKRMSYYMLARRSSVPISTVMNICHCTTKNPGIFTLIRLCAALDITVPEFFDTEEFLELTSLENQEN